MSRLSPATLLAGVAVLGIAAVVVAVALQHLRGMEPCPWCVLQRAIFLAMAIAGGIGLLLPFRPVRALIGGIGVLLALSGMASALWQHFAAAATDSCAVSLADRIVVGLHLDTLWPDLFLATAPCADATAELFGIPFPYWSLALFALMGLACLLAIRDRRL